MKKLIIKNKDVTSGSTKGSKKFIKKNVDDEERRNSRIAESSDIPVWMESFNSIVKNISPEVIEKTVIDETIVSERNLQLEYTSTNIENRFAGGDFRK